jgi:hypothetical protein
MPGNWGNLDCPGCGQAHAAPKNPGTECEALTADLVCADCGKGWQIRVELWDYYGIEKELPSRKDDR